MTERYIPRDQKVYSSRPKGIFLTTERYIPRDRKVYSSRPKGIFLTTKRYIPHDRKVYTFLRQAIELHLCATEGRLQQQPMRRPKKSPGPVVNATAGPRLIPSKRRENAYFVRRRKLSSISSLMKLSPRPVKKLFEPYLTFQSARLILKGLLAMA